MQIIVWKVEKNHTSEPPQPSVFFRFLSSSFFFYLFIFFFLLVKIFGKLDPPDENSWIRAWSTFLCLMGDNKTPLLFEKGGGQDIDLKF